MKLLFGEKCIGCNACAKTCPAVFGFDKDKRRAYIRPGADIDAHESAVRDAALMCLTGNIKIIDNGQLTIRAADGRNGELTMDNGPTML